ncbi:hypothetical protein ACIBP6_44125 [Nonomuraea terrae]|uniref:hypothetical protein n=1 Tax=Nonomuraea terrae TaxID=2530383 RepID=UPI0037ACA957
MLSRARKIVQMPAKEDDHLREIRTLLAKPDPSPAAQATVLQHAPPHTPADRQLSGVEVGVVPGESPGAGTGIGT